MKRFLLKRLLLVPLGVAAYLAARYAQGNPDWTEQVYSQSAYPVLSAAAGFLPSLVGFSVAEWVSVLFVLFCLGYAGCCIRRIVVGREGRGVAMTGAGRDAPAEKGRGMVVYRSLTGVLAIACAVYFAFTALCGLNYYRQTFTSSTGYSIEQSVVEELEQLCTSLAEETGQAREQLGDVGDLGASRSGGFGYYAQHSVSAMRTLAGQYPVLGRVQYRAPKPVVMSELMSYAGIAGIFFPFTAESNVNADAPFFTLPATMAHELAHQCGFMREDEANFIAYLACRQSDDPLVRYSGLILALDHSVSALRKVDPQRAEEIASGLPPAVQRDRVQRTQFWARYEGVAADASHALNDTYLKANSQVDGVQSYGRMVDLLLAERRAGAG